MEKTHEFFLEYSLDLAAKQAGGACLGGPFAAVIVKNGEIIAEGSNQVTVSNDPTAHAEIVAIREACKKLQSFQLDDCIIYSSCEPCPMCLGAIFWARPKAVYFASTRIHAAEAGFDDAFIYEQINLAGDLRQIPFIYSLRENSLAPFVIWAANSQKINY
jgi:guanine deaminase